MPRGTFSGPFTPQRRLKDCVLKPCVVGERIAKPHIYALKSRIVDCSISNYFKGFLSWETIVWFVKRSMAFYRNVSIAREFIIQSAWTVKNMNHCNLSQI